VAGGRAGGGGDRFRKINMNLPEVFWLFLDTGMYVPKSLYDVCSRTILESLSAKKYEHYILYKLAGNTTHLYFT
jgi:hypothetical protein